MGENMSFKIDRTKALEKYVKHAKDAADELVENFCKRSDIIDLATSEAAQKLWIAKITDPKVQERRIKNLKKVSITELHTAMREYGGENYKKGVEKKKTKWQKRVEPYFDVIESVVPTLPPKTADPMENIDNRLKAIVAALVKKKEEIG